MPPGDIDVRSFNRRSRLLLLTEPWGVAREGREVSSGFRKRSGVVKKRHFAYKRPWPKAEALSPTQASSVRSEISDTILRIVAFWAQQGLGLLSRVYTCIGACPATSGLPSFMFGLFAVCAIDAQGEQGPSVASSMLSHLPTPARAYNSASGKRDMRRPRCRCAPTVEPRSLTHVDGVSTKGLPSMAVARAHIRTRVL